MTRWSGGDPEVVARAILASPRYRLDASRATYPPKASVWHAVMQWFLEHVLRPLFAPLGRALHASQSVGTVLGVILVIAAVALLAFLVGRLIVAFVQVPGRGRSAARAGSALAEMLSAADWSRRARAAAAAGDFARAIAALFSGALAALDERGIVTFDAARTPGEYRRLVRRAVREAAVPFDALTERFVRAAYAQTVIDAEDFAVAERAYATFEPVATS